MLPPSTGELARGHSSRWVRVVIRALSIRGATWLILALALFATTVVCQQVWRGRNEARESRLQADSTILENAMLERLHRYAQILQGVRGVFDASNDVEKSEFSAFVGSMRAGYEYPGILALGFIENVEHARRGDFMAQAAIEHGDAFRIHPAGTRPDYLVVRFVEPPDLNRAALGYDIGSEALRRAAAISSRDSARATLTARIDLVQSPGQPGAILFEPVYAGGARPVSIDERRSRLKGWVYAAFVIGDMMSGVPQLTKTPLEFELYDGAATSAGNLLCRGGNATPISPGHGFEQDTRLVIFDRPWTLRTRASMSAASEPGILPVWVLGAAGVCMSLLIFGVARSMATTSRRACSLAEGMTVELRQHEEALRSSEERLAMVIKGSNDGIWDWNVITNEVYFSPRWKSMLGYEDQEIANNFAAWESLLHPDDRDRAQKIVRGYFEGKIPTYQLEHRLRHKDGCYRWILARGVASRDTDGRPVRMAGSHVDLTEIKLAEQELRRANQELQDSQERLQSTLSALSYSHEKLEKTQLELIQAAKLESVGTLAAGVAHEVKNPLQIIIMGLDFLDQRLRDGDETTSTTLSDMRDAALRADSITRELLHFSSATDFLPAPTDLEAVLERSLWLLRTDITKSGVTISKNLTGNLPPVSIDTPKIQQVFINLIINSLQAMDHDGTLAITMVSGRLGRLLPPHFQATCQLKPEDHVVMLKLHDSGPGIPDDQLRRIFDPFFTTKAVGTGTGLGLSVVKNIIDLHKALIHFRNSPHGGLEVTLAFATIQQATAPASPGAVLVEK